MNRIDLPTAISEIHSAYEFSPKRSPFFFVIGAGVSAPSVPLSRAITEHCREKALVRDPQTSDGDLHTSIQRYSFWFDRAYPQPIDRQRFLRSLIENKQITDSNLRLAHLLLSGKISNLVVTPNFDDHLSRSLSIFGANHIVSDHPHTVDRIDLEGDDIQIVHVHGSYLFYDCSNLEEELEYRARPSLTSTKTMAAFLDRVLSFRSPIVVGYAGWEGDVIMASLRRRLEGNNLPYRVYWLCYRDDDAASLPSWLTDHNDIRIVTGDKIGSQQREKMQPEPDTVLQQEVNSSLGNELSARRVFEELSRAFGLTEPELTRNPLRFFAKRLRESIYLGGTDDERVYFFSDVISRVERAADLESQQPDSETDGSTDLLRLTQAQLVLIKDAVRRSRYDQAVSTASSLDINALSAQDAADLFDVFRATGQKETTQQTIHILDFIIRLGEKLIINEDAESWNRYYLSPNVEKAVALIRLDQPEIAIQVIDGQIQRVPAALRSQLEEELLYAESRKALALGKLGRIQEELSLYKKIIQRLEELNTPSIQWLLSQSRYNYAVDLSQAGQLNEAIAAYGSYANTYSDATDGWTQVLVAAALRGKASILRQTGQSLEAVEAVDGLIKLYGTSNHPQVSPVVTRAFGIKALALQDLGRHEEAVIAMSEAGRRFKEERKTPQQVDSGAGKPVSDSRAKSKRRKPRKRRGTT